MEDKKQVKQEKKIVKNKKEETKQKKKTSKPNKSLNFVWALFGVFVLIFVATLTVATILVVRFSGEISSYINNWDKDSTTEQTEIIVTEEEKNVINIVNENAQSVVSIAVSKLSFTQSQGLIDTSNNIGTGFVVNKDGIIVTNQHVVSDLDEDYKVVTSDGDEYEVVEIVRDDINDIAILKIDAENLNPVELGDSGKLAVGQSVIAIGTPLGEYSGTVTSGIISGLNRSVSASDNWFGSTAKTYEDVIQTDTAINPGNSGGPLINSQGQVIGVNFATTSGADNISFAIPISKVKSRVEEYRTYGKFIKPYLGVSYQMISEYEALYYENVVSGALIVRLDPMGPAYSAGIKRGDIVTDFAGESVAVSLSQLIQQQEVGDEVDIKIWRDGKQLDVKVSLVEAD